MASSQAERDRSRKDFNRSKTFFLHSKSISIGMKWLLMRNYTCDCY
jgi:hypothetical protein